MPNIMVGQRPLHYEDQGQGVPLVFIHPPLLSSANFVYQVNDLARDHRVVCIDVPGHGDSMPLQGRLTYHAIAEDIRRLLDGLGEERAVICGYSTGGSVALEYLLNHPERALGAVIISGMSEIPNALVKGLIVSAVATLEAKIGAALQTAIALGNADCVVTFLRLLHAARRADIRSATDYFACSATYNCTDRLQTIQHPVQLVFGSRDRRFQSAVKLLSAELQNHELVLVSGVTHQIPTKAARELNSVIRRFASAIQ